MATTKTTKKVETQEIKTDGVAPIAKPSVKYNDLSAYSIKELLDLKESTQALIAYYDNYAKANTGNYEFNALELYAEAREQSEKYNRALAKIYIALENKVNLILYK